MNIMKMSFRVSMFLLGTLLFTFSSCEKNEIEANHSKEVLFEYFNQQENSEPSSSTLEDDGLTYLEIFEEDQAQPGEEMFLIIEDGPFLNGDGETVEGGIEIKTTIEGGRFFTIAVSQNLIDQGVIDPDLGSLYKKWKDYYAECMDNMCSPPPNMPMQRCHGNCVHAH